jgi:hypothetical protein
MRTKTVGSSCASKSPRGCRGQQLFDRGALLRTDALARPTERFGEALSAERLQQIVDRVHLERAHGVAVVASDEDDRNVAADELDFGVGMSTYHPSGTRMVDPPINVKTSITASSPGATAVLRKSRSARPMIVVMFAPRKRGALLTCW